MQKVAHNFRLAIGQKNEPGRSEVSHEAVAVIRSYGAGGIARSDGADRTSLNLEAAVGRPLGCVPRGVRQGTTRRNSRPIPTSCKAAGRRAGRAPGVVAGFTQ
jgi:hypothetical protein